MPDGWRSNDIVRSSIKQSLTALGIAAIVSGAVLVHDDARVWATASFNIHPCSNTDLLMRPMKEGLGAAAGHVGRWYRIHHPWGSACSLQGFPGVDPLDAHFHSLPIQIGHSGYIITATLPERQVIIDQRHDAYFALEYTDVRYCKSAPYLMVFPPGDKLPVVTYSGGLAPCPGAIDSSPVEARAVLR
jgi:hypothetical protein